MSETITCERCDHSWQDNMVAPIKCSECGTVAETKQILTVTVRLSMPAPIMPILLYNELMMGIDGVCQTIEEEHEEAICHITSVEEETIQ